MSRPLRNASVPCLTLICFVALAGCRGGTAVLPLEEIPGTWTGSVEQKNPDSEALSFAVHLTIEGDGMAGELRLPENNCTGSLRASRKSQDRRLVFQLTFPAGQRCLPGTVTLTPSSGHLIYRWSEADGDRDSTGKLYR